MMKKILIIITLACLSILTYGQSERVFNSNMKISKVAPRFTLSGLGATILMDGATSGTTTLRPYAAAGGTIVIPQSAGTDTLQTNAGVRLIYAPKANATFTGTITLPSGTSIGDVSSTEIGYVNNVTSSIQTQINGLAASSLGDTILTSADQTRMRTSANWTANTSYEIRDSINLGGNTIDFPDGVTLKFNGGLLANGKLNGDHTTFISNNKKIFDTSITWDGDWQTNTITPLDFGAISHDTNTVFTDDISDMLQACINSPFRVYIPAGNYYFADSMQIVKPTTIIMDGGVSQSTEHQFADAYNINFVQKIGTRLYTDKNIDCFIIRSGRVEITGNGLIDYFNAPNTSTEAAVHFDLNYRIMDCKIELNFMSSYANVCTAGFALKGIFIDGTNLWGAASRGGNIAWCDFNIKTLYVAYPFYFPAWEDEVHGQWAASFNINLVADGAKQYVVLAENEVAAVNVVAETQDREDALVGDEADLPGFRINTVASTFDINLADIAHTYFVIDSGIANEYKGKSIRDQREFEDASIVFKRGRPGTYSSIENPYLFQINQAGVSSYRTPGISYFQNGFAYIKDRNPDYCVIYHKDGTGYDFDTNLGRYDTKALSDHANTVISGTGMADTAKFFRLRGSKPTVTFTNADAMTNGFVEINISVPSTYFVGYKPYELNYFLTSQYVNTYFNRIQSILISSADTLISNIYPHESNQHYKPFTYDEINGFSIGTGVRLIIRFIGCSQLNKAIEISDIFARDGYNQIPPLIDIGGGQSIYGSLSLINTPTTSTSSGTLTAQNDSILGRSTVKGRISTPIINDAYIAAGGPSATEILNPGERYTGTDARDFTNNPQIPDGTDGQTWTLMTTSDTYTLTLDNGTGLSLSTSKFIMGAGDAITLRYNTTEDIWRELSRVDNIPRGSTGLETIVKTIGWDGATGTDFKWSGDAGHAAQHLDLGAIIPAKARVTAIEIVCTQVLAGCTDMTFAAGNASAGEQFIAAGGTSCDEANEVVGIIDATKPAAVVMNWASATNIWIDGDPSDNNWSDMTSGKWSVYVTYMVYK